MVLLAGQIHLSFDVGFAGQCGGLQLFDQLGLPLREIGWLQQVAANQLIKQDRMAGQVGGSPVR